MASKLTKEERERRNLRILELFIAGVSYRRIGAHPTVNLTGMQVHNIVKEMMKDAALRQELLSDLALQVYVERLEELLRVSWVQAMGGDLKAVEVSRRILDQQARLYDLEEQGRAPAIPPMSDEELADDDDELATYRRRHRKRG